MARSQGLVAPFSRFNYNPNGNFNDRFQGLGGSTILAKETGLPIFSLVLGRRSGGDSVVVGMLVDQSYVGWSVMISIYSEKNSPIIQYSGAETLVAWVDSVTNNVPSVTYGELYPDVNYIEERFRQPASDLTTWHNVFTVPLRSDVSFVQVYRSPRSSQQLTYSTVVMTLLPPRAV